MKKLIFGVVAIATTPFIFFPQIVFVSDESSIILDAPGTSITVGSDVDVVKGVSFRSRESPDEHYSAGTQIVWDDCTSEKAVCRDLIERLKAIIKKLEDPDLKRLAREVELLEHRPMYVQEGILGGDLNLSRGISAGKNSTNLGPDRGQGQQEIPAEKTIQEDPVNNLPEKIGASGAGSGGEIETEERKRKLVEEEVKRERTAMKQESLDSEAQEEGEDER